MSRDMGKIEAELNKKNADYIRKTKKVGIKLSRV
jgi:hypothetical protein